MRYLPLASSAQTAYSDLLASLCLSAIPDRGISYFTRKVKGKDYWYVQHTVGSSKRSRYIGPDREEIRQRVAQCRRKQDETKLLAPKLNRLVATCAATGLHTLTAAEARVYEVLAQSGVFEAGAVIVGTHAFLHIGNMLCVQWEQPVQRTDDLDIARQQTIAVASPPVEADIRETLLKADKGIFAVPALDPREPSTRFRYRNQELTVSMLTPMRGRPSSNPVLLTGLNAAAKPIRFLDYLIDDNQLAAVPAGSGILIRVPHPARFALHKLAVSQRRPAAFAAKSRRDLAQAAAVLDVLKGLRPGDIDLAADAALQMGDKFVNQLTAAASLLEDKLATRVRDAVARCAVQPLPKP